jgi:hypothetical protein
MKNPNSKPTKLDRERRKRVREWLKELARRKRAESQLMLDLIDNIEDRCALTGR